MPQLFVLAGPNGAGKSTAAPKVLSGPRRVDEFVNADVIQKAARVSEVEAGRRTLARLDELMRARRNIAFETTLSRRRFQAGRCCLASNPCRYERGLQNLLSIYLGIADSWQLLNNTDSPGRSIAWRDVGRQIVTLQPEEIDI